MSEKEKLISGIRKQYETLGDLMTELMKRSDLDPASCHLYELTTKQVENNLKKLRKIAVGELTKEVRMDRPQLNREDV